MYSSHSLSRSLCYFIGKSGDIEAETIVFVLEHEGEITPWIIPKEEIKKR